MVYQGVVDLVVDRVAGCEMVEGMLNSMGDNEAMLERRRRESSRERKDDLENPPSRSRAYGDEDDIEVSFRTPVRLYDLLSGRLLWSKKETRIKEITDVNLDSNLGNLCCPYFFPPFPRACWVRIFPSCLENSLIQTLLQV